MINLAGTPEIKENLYWFNSANVLCKYMKEQRFLDQILKDQAISPRYVLESVEYLGISELRSICFPMVCFCDIPFSKVSTHMSHYGEYGIGLKKDNLRKNFGIQPIHYINEYSPLSEDFRSIFLKYFNEGRTSDKSIEVLLNYIMIDLMYMKPISGSYSDEKVHITNYVFQDECEWRYVPFNEFPEELKPIVLRQVHTSKKMRDEFSKTLYSYAKCRLAFQWDDILYIIVPDDQSVEATIDTICHLDIEEKWKLYLISKIEIGHQFKDNV